MTTIRYVRDADGSVHYIADVRAANPHISIPDGADCTALGYPFLSLVAPPAALPGMRVVEVAPVKIAGSWRQLWEHQPIPADEVQREIVTCTQKRLDDWARTRNYDGVLSLCTYATSSVPRFAAEGQRGVDLRDQTWAALYAIMGEVQAAMRPMPTGYADIEPLLPVLTWPD